VGILVLLVAGVTSLLGVLHALMEHDLKRLLAYHTVENIGIIFIGLGLALAFEASGLHVAAALALIAAVFHVFNHSLFKSLLFLGAGAVLTATGERDMERMGGLIHPHADYGAGIPGGLHRDLGAAAVQRLRVRVAHVSGDPPQSATAAVDTAIADPGHRRHARMLRRVGSSVFRQSLRLDIPRPPPRSRGGVRQ
jgi:hypothetical protein